MNKFIQQCIRLGTPSRFYRLCDFLYPICLLAGITLTLIGAIQGLWFAPADYQQGDAFRIMYVHVPCAILSLGLYVSLAVASIIYLIWRIKIADIYAYSVAPIGAFFTLAALVTGSLWGKPMWGTWWIWDARLTSELILLFLYIGYIGLYQSVAHHKSAARICAIFAIIGLIDIPIIHYSVYWWNTLHQGSSISFTKTSIAKPMLFPLIWVLIGFAFYTAALVTSRIRSVILQRERHQYWVSNYG